VQHGHVTSFVDVVSFDVERGKIQEFARSTFAEDRVYIDPQAARLRGLPDVPATPTYVAVSLHQRDQRAWVAGLGLDIDRVVVGSVSWTFHRPLVAGDVVVGERRVISDRVKRGKQGTLRILMLQTDFVDETGDIVVTQVDQILERPAP
jgi:hypothetical protein